jgi:hypothetical protein
MSVGNQDTLAKDGLQRARCVVWRRRGTAVPDHLTHALSRAGCAAVHAESEFEAMVYLCRAGQGGVNVLLVVEPSAQPAMGELLEVADRYVPDAALWAYEGSPAPQIRAVGSVERGAWRSQEKPWPALATPKAREPRPSAPALRLAGDEDEGPKMSAPAPLPEVKAPRSSNNKPLPGGMEQETRPERPAHLLTDEELAMLLAIEPRKAHN